MFILFFKCFSNLFELAEENRRFGACRKYHANLMHKGSIKAKYTDFFTRIAMWKGRTCSNSSTLSIKGAALW
jgi:type 1 glutamine amidotransferase